LARHWSGLVRAEFVTVADEFQIFTVKERLFWFGQRGRFHFERLKAVNLLL
jgi:hypothetical protein